MLLSGSNDEIFRLVVLEYQPHALHIVFSIAPVAQRRQVAQQQLVLLALGNTRGSEGDFASDKCFTPALRLVIEQNARTAKHIISLPVFFHNPVAVQFGNGIGRIGVERGILVLRYFFHLAVQFRSGCLVDTAGIGDVALTNGFQNTQHTGGVYICRKFG